jgi:LuxR family maltose regulon positive regulatory protein
MELVDPLIHTKLHRPPLPADLVPRPRLIEHLYPNTLPPLILISAPAGYGKSTLAKCLVEGIDCPSTWISLDERDDDLVAFLSYFLSAVQLIFPGVGDETREMLKASALPPVQILITNLINELDQNQEDYLLVLDDYHTSMNPATGSTAAPSTANISPYPIHPPGPAAFPDQTARPRQDYRISC